ncbi:MAG: PEP-CTERM sorting domain-containing protein [Methylophilus sp.]|nr:PEP-CTERM sorting domain-containing protein [Methylophilus sp.]
MRIISKLVFVAVLAILPAVASASVDTLSFSCSSNLEVSFENGYHASCGGDFTFDSGALIDDTSITLTSLGALNINSSVSLIAPYIKLSGPIINIAFGAVLDAGYVGLPINIPEVKVPYILEPKKPLTVSQVPEPSSLSMLAIGLFGMSLFARRNAKQN